MDAGARTYYIPNMKSEAADRLTPAQLEGAAVVFAALGHPVRLRIVAGLLSGECCVGPMAECLGLSQPFVSRHLAVLREAGVITSRVEGRQRVYRVSHPAAASFVTAVQSTSWGEP